MPQGPRGGGGHLHGQATRSSPGFVDSLDWAGSCCVNTWQEMLEAWGAWAGRGGGVNGGWGRKRMGSVPRESFGPCQPQARGAWVCGVCLSQLCTQVFARFTRCALLGGPDVLGVSMRPGVCVCVCECVCVCTHLACLCVCPTLSTYLDCSKPPPQPSSFFLIIKLYTLGGFPDGSGGLSICLQYRRPGFDPWVRKIPWRKAWQPTPVFLPGESQGQKRLSGYSPWGQKVSYTSEQLSTHTHA